MSVTPSNLYRKIGVIEYNNLVSNDEFPDLRKYINILSFEPSDPKNIIISKIIPLVSDYFKTPDPGTLDKIEEMGVKIKKVYEHIQSVVSANGQVSKRVGIYISPELYYGIADLIFHDAIIDLKCCKKFTSTVMLETFIQLCIYAVKAQVPINYLVIVNLYDMKVCTIKVSDIADKIKKVYDKLISLNDSDKK